MLHIILIILKIIGIILAVILGILFLLICTVLFVPVRYQGAVKWDEQWEHLRIRGRISWLLHLFEIRFVYKDGQAAVRIRIPWKTMRKAFSPHGSDVSAQLEPDAALHDDKEQGKEKEKDEEKDQQHNTEPEKTEAAKPADQICEKTDPVCQKVSEKNVSRTSAEESISHKKKGHSRNPKKIFRIQNFLKKAWEKAVSAIRRLKCTFEKICVKIKLFFQMKEQVSAFIEKEEHKTAYRIIRNEGMRLLRALLPKKLELSVCFGFEDPCHTGQMLALLAAVYPFIPGELNVHPDFEKRMFRGKGSVYGSVRIVHFLFAAFQLFRRKAVRQTYHDIRILLQTVG